jgi:hypothetical protein
MGSFFYEQSSFNAGIHNPLIQGNSKSPKRDSAVKDSLNVFPMVQGGLIRRGGTKFISAVKFSDKSCFFLRFKFGTTSAVQMISFPLLLWYQRQISPFFIALRLFLAW